MVQFSNCKINLGLNIVSKRDDGYHNIETCFYPIPFFDVLEIIHSTEFSLTHTGLTIDSPQEYNLCYTAYNLLRKDYPQITNSKIHLHKNIPMGAGIGGGSANAAYTLLLFNKKYNLQLTETDLLNYAAQIGSDCAFFIKNTPCIATSRGEELDPISVALNGYDIALVFPPIHISTKEAFANIIPQKPVLSIKNIIQEPIETWKNVLLNDFEKSIFPRFTLLKTIKEELYKNDALYASMSGSGSTIYGIFKKDLMTEDRMNSAFPNKQWKLIKL